MENNVLEVLKTRRSCRNYKTEQVPDELLEKILEAGTYAATAKGSQSAKIIVIQDQETIKKITKMNAAFTSGKDPFYAPPTILLVLADCKPCGRDNAIKDGSLVLGNMMIAAHALDLASCWINRADKELDTEEGQALLKAWGIEGDYIGVGHLSLGYAEGPLPEAKPRKTEYIVRV